MPKVKNKFITAINTSDGRRFEKGVKVLQIPSGGEGQVVSIVDEGRVQVQIDTPNDNPFLVILPVVELIPVPAKEEESEETNEESE